MNLKFIFICSPSLGILDNWIPVIWNLKKQYKNAEFTIVFPRERTLLEINKESILNKLTNECFDNVLFRKCVSWDSENSLYQAVSKVNTKKYRHHSQFVSFCKQIPIVSKLLGFVDSIISDKYLKNWKNQNNKYESKSILLCDIYEETKDYNQLFFNEMGEVTRFSIHHGVNVINGGILTESSKKYNIKEIKNRIVFTFSHLDYDVWKYRYGLQDNQIIEAGIAKHDERWIELIKENSGNDIESLPDRFIGLIGRPVSNYLPRDRKVKYLRDIKKSSEEFNLPIVVKRHPKEKLDGTYEEVFGSTNLGVTWFISDAHWFALSDKCHFAVSFFSSVPADLIKLNIPVIEYLNLNGLSEYDHKDALRDKTGNPVFSYRYLDLVYGVDNTEEFTRIVNDIMVNRETIVKQLQTRYKSIFKNPEDSLNIILESISHYTLDHSDLDKIS
jgi:hypothetical protein